MVDDGATLTGCWTGEAQAATKESNGKTRRYILRRISHRVGDRRGNVASRESRVAGRESRVASRESRVAGPPPGYAVLPPNSLADARSRGETLSPNPLGSSPRSEATLGEVAPWAGGGKTVTGRESRVAGLQTPPKTAWPSDGRGRREASGVGSRQQQQRSAIGHRASAKKVAGRGSSNPSQDGATVEREGSMRSIGGGRHETRDPRPGTAYSHRPSPGMKTGTAPDIAVESPA